MDTWREQNQLFCEGHGNGSTFDIFQWSICGMLSNRPPADWSLLHSFTSDMDDKVRESINCTCNMLGSEFKKPNTGSPNPYPYSHLQPLPLSALLSRSCLQILCYCLNTANHSTNTNESINSIGIDANARNQARKTFSPVSITSSFHVSPHFLGDASPLFSVSSL